MANDPRSLLDKLIGVCLSVMVAAMALTVAINVVKPYVDVVVLVAGVVVVVLAWRSWSRSRW